MLRTLPQPDTLLGGLSIEAFLEHYWQKKPLLVRGAIPHFISPLTPEQLMELSCETDAEARLILEKHGDYPWQLLHGPFEEDFHDLPASHWTLLVQEVNRFVPEVSKLLDSFRFIPSWRIDDIMVSYAPDQGGVGAHVDNYDVFLLQGMGHRRWQIMNTPVEEEIILPDLDIRILQRFRPDEDWVLSPGDMLYLPPRIPHKGVAEKDCMTFSIGFRAPSHRDILSNFIGYAAELADPLTRYSDPDLSLQSHPSEIQPDVLTKVRQVILDAIKDEKLIDTWFGSYITESQRGYTSFPLEDTLTPQDVIEQLDNDATLQRVPGITFAFFLDPEGDAQLFANGLTFLFPSPIARSVPVICEADTIHQTNLSPVLESEVFLELLTEMINEGLLAFTESDG